MNDLLHYVHRDVNGKRIFRGGYILSVKPMFGRTLVVTHRRTYWLSVQLSGAPFKTRLPMLLEPDEVAELRCLLRAHHWAEKYGLCEENRISMDGGGCVVSDGGVLYQHMHAKDDLGHEMWRASMEAKRTNRNDGLGRQRGDSPNAFEMLSVGGKSHQPWNMWLWTKRGNRRVCVPMGVRTVRSSNEDFALVDEIRREPNLVSPLSPPSKRDYLERHSLRVGRIMAINGWFKNDGGDWEQRNFEVDANNPRGFYRGLVRRSIEEIYIKGHNVLVEPTAYPNPEACINCGAAAEKTVLDTDGKEKVVSNWSKRKHALVCKTCGREKWLWRAVITLPQSLFTHKGWKDNERVEIPGTVFPWKLVRGAEALRAEVYGPYAARLLDYVQRCKVSSVLVRRAWSKKLVRQISDTIKYLLAKGA